MASIIQTSATDQDLKFIQLKKYKLSQENQNGSGSCLAVDQKNQIIFVCCQNDLIYVPLTSLLNFDVWTKDFLKTVEKNVPAKTTIKIDQNQLNSNLVSISSKGYGSKLIVACHDPVNLSSFILFYHIDSLYQFKENCCSYNRFNFPSSDSGLNQLRFLSWHPEMNDNVFACSLADGSFYVLYIEDFPQKNLSVLVHLPNDRQISAFSWSPKGKQIVISFKNSFFAQYKLQLNENNLVQNSNIQESKRIPLPDNYNGFKIVNIFWLTTFNFIVICRNVENETIFLLVSVPSSKATGANALIKIIDFGRLIFETLDCISLFEGNIFPLENVIFFYTNTSSDFSLIGCNSSEINICEKWTEITIDDDYRLMVDDDCTVMIRGLNFINGTPKQFKLASMEKGGLNRPYALTYNSVGHLTLFLVDYENTQNENFLKVPVAPKNVKPRMTINIQETTSVEATDSKPLSSVVPSFNLNPVTSQSTFPNNQTIQFSTNSVANTSANVTKPVATSVANQRNLNFGNVNNKTVTFNQPPPISKTDSKVASPITIATTTTTANLDPPQVKNLYVEEILVNIKEFDKQLKSTMNSLKDSLNHTTIDEDENIKYESEFVMQMLEKLLSSFGLLNHDVNDLQASCLEVQYLVEETSSLLDRNADPKYKSILQQRNLDPLTSRRLKEINKMKDYIEIQIRELNNKFDLEWREYIQKKKKNKGFSPNTNNRFMEEDFLEKNVTTLVHKTLNNNQQLIDNLNQQIKVILNNLSLVQKQEKLKFGSNGKFNDDAQGLIKMLQDASIGSKNQTDSAKINVLRCISADRKSSLKSFLENRHSVPLRVCRPSNNGDFNQKSRFTLVLEKIKAKKQLSRNLEQIQDAFAKELPNNCVHRKEESKPKIIPTSGAKQTFSASMQNSKLVMDNQSVDSNVMTSSAEIPTFSFKLPSKANVANVEAKVTLSIPKFQQSQKQQGSQQEQMDMNKTTVCISSLTMANVQQSSTFSLAQSNESKPSMMMESKQPETINVSASAPSNNNRQQTTNESTNFNFPTAFSFDSSSLFNVNKTSSESVLSNSSTKSNINATSTAATTTTATTATSSLSFFSSSSTRLPSFSTLMFDGGQQQQQPQSTNSIISDNSKPNSSIINKSPTVEQKQVTTANKSPLLQLPDDDNNDEKKCKEVISPTSTVSSITVGGYASLSSSSPCSLPTTSIFSQSSFGSSTTKPTSGINQQQTTTTTTTTVATKPSFSFTGSLSNLNLSNNNNKSSENAIGVVAASENNSASAATIIKTVTDNTAAGKISQETISSSPSNVTSIAITSSESVVTTTATVVNAPFSTVTCQVPATTVTTISSPFSSALKPSFPSFSSSLFETPKSTSSLITSAPESSTIQSQPFGFNFKNTLSSLSLTDANTGTSTSTANNSGSNIFGSNPFGVQSTVLTTSQQPSILGNATNNQQSNLFGSICSPQQPKPQTTTISPFGSFSFGNTPANTSTNVFGQQPNSGSSLFSKSPQPGQSLFGLPSFACQPQQPKPLFNAPAFGSPPGTGGAVFGGGPVFGGTPAFGSGFGIMSNQSLQPFTNTNHSFGSMAFKNEPMPSFDSLANDNKTGNSTAPNFGGSGQRQFFSTISQNNNSDAFTQRRG